MFHADDRTDMMKTRVAFISLLMCLFEKNIMVVPDVFNICWATTYTKGLCSGHIMLVIKPTGKK